MASQTVLSLAEFARMEDPPGKILELSAGELIVSPSSSQMHNTVRDNINARLRAFVKEHDLGIVACEADLILAPHTVRRPDVAWIGKDKITGLDLDQSPLPAAPDVVIEIVSRHDRAPDLELKTRQYLAAGARAVWLLDPRARTARRYRPQSTEPEFRDRWEEPQLLPGFTFTLSEVLE